MHPAAAPGPGLPGRRARRWSLTRALSFGFSALAVGVVLAMLAVFVAQSLPVWGHAGLGFVSETRWFYRSAEFGALPMLYGTLVVSLIALLLAAPVGIGAAIFATEFVHPRLRLALKIVIELLAGIPSVVYGLLGILLLREWIYRALTPFDPLSGDTLLTAGVLLALMVLPTVMTLSDDALHGVPAPQRLAARALGLTQAETILSVSLPQAAPGILAAVLLGLGRALGETIAVFLVVGRQDNQWPESLFLPRPIIEAGQTLTSKLGGSETHIAYGDPLHWAAMAGLGLLLLALVGVVTLAGARLMRGRRRYA
jgi:phosphate transport system permease protein